MQVSLTEANSRLPELVRIAEGGEAVVITRHGRPVAQIVPPSPEKRHVQFDSMRDRIKLNPGWDAPITEDELLGESE